MYTDNVRHIRVNANMPITIFKEVADIRRQVASVKVVNVIFSDAI